MIEDRELPLSLSLETPLCVGARETRGRSAGERDDQLADARLNPRE